MSTIRFKKFIRPAFLRQIGRPGLGRLLNRFAPELAASGVVLPGADLGEEAYYRALSELLMAPEGLPEVLVEALYAIEGLATPDGQERLERAVRAEGLMIPILRNSTTAEIVMQVWVVAPSIVERQHAEQRLSRLSALEYFGTRTPVDRRGIFQPPGPAIIARLEQDMDEWFHAHQRGQETAQVQVQMTDGECCFMVRHGDTYTRTAKVERHKTEVLHYRPAKEDVIVYSPERDELRMHASTKGEREMYRRAFGRRLFGSADHFSERKAYTLEPLRTDMADALSVEGVPGIRRIVLREVEVTWDRRGQEVTVRKSNDVFGAPVRRGSEVERIPEGGELKRAVFDVYFGHGTRPRKVQVRPPNVLKVGRHCDARLVQEWLSRRGFREVVGGVMTKDEGGAVRSAQCSVLRAAESAHAERLNAGPSDDGTTGQ